MTANMASKETNMDDREKENRAKMANAVATIRSKIAQNEEVLVAMLAKRIFDHGPQSEPMTAEQAEKLLDEK